MVEAVSRQCVILVGGLGTRLGRLVADCPKPMLPVGGKPFLEHLIGEIARFGFDDFILLAGYKAEVVAAHFDRRGPHRLREGIRLRVVAEATPLGTGGALRGAWQWLAPEFLMVNGDSLFSFNFLALATESSQVSQAHIALRRVPEARRFGVVTLAADNRVTRFAARPDADGQGLINGGVYWLNRDIVRGFSAGVVSLENDIFPQLAAAGVLSAAEFAGPFIDIGIPESYAEAEAVLSETFRRPAVFFDRDNTLTRDLGYTHRLQDLSFMDGAIAAVRAVNDNGYYAFVITNQAGIARGLYSAHDVNVFHAALQEELRRHGAHIDEFRYCPHHPDGIIPELAVPCACRKPGPAMIDMLARAWPVDLARSTIVGDQDSDHAAGVAAGVAQLGRAAGL